MSKTLTATVDAGLAGLGMACRTFAGVGICVAAASAVLVPMVGGSAGSNPLIWLWVVTAMIRTGLHLSLGEQALRRSPGVERAALIYLMSAVAHTGIGIAWMAMAGILGGATVLFVLGLLVISLAWPITIYLVTRRPALRAAFAAADTFDTSLVPADRGINSAAVLLIGFSSSTLGVPIAIIGQLLAQQGPAAPSYYLVLVACGVLLARGIYAFDLGVRTHFGRLAPTDFRRRVGVYRGLALASIVALSAALLSIDMVRQVLGGKPLIGFITIAALVAGTWVWPHVLGRFLTQLDHEDATEELEPAVTTASDAGAVTLGQYIFYFGWLALGMNLIGHSLIGLVPQLGSVPGLDALSGDITIVGILGLLSLAAYLAVGGTLITLKSVDRLLRPLIGVWVLTSGAELIFTLTSSDLGAAVGTLDILVGVLSFAISTGGLVALVMPILRRSGDGSARGEMT